MKIQYCSDLHLEFRKNSEFLKANPLKPVGDILVLAGDITLIGEQFFANPFFDYVSDNFEKTLMVAGNHEFYSGKDLSIQDTPFVENIRKNVYFVNNTTVTINNIALIFTTLWAKIRPELQYYTERGVSDFFKIRYKRKKFTAEMFNEQFEKSFAFLQREVAKNRDKTTVVVTHHVPTNLCCPHEFKGSAINGAFVVELSDYIYEADIKYWIYGHSHRNLDEQIINDTRIVTNQLGYVQQNEHKNFKTDAYLTL